MELPIANFYECLTSCLKKFGRNCRSIEYSHAKEVCRFSDRFVVGPLGQNDKEALVEDDNFDYYQFMWSKSIDRHAIQSNRILLHRVLFFLLHETIT